jgi:hypothetical protein
MNILLWVLQCALAFLCISGGLYQLAQLDELKKGVAAMRELPKPLWMFLGALGALAGLGLIVPGVVGPLPILVAVSAAVVVVHSGLISGFYLYFGDKAPLPYALAMTAMAAFICAGRLFLSPL